MKRILILTVCGGLAFASCTDFDFSNDRTQQIKDNAEEIFGIIDPNQDWNMVTSGTVTVTADAPLTDVAKVQILSESPFFNDQAKVLSSVETSKGETVTLNYDAPRGTERLIAACVDSKGNFFIKGFYVGTDKVSFVKASNARTRSMTRAGGSSDLSGVTMSSSNSFLSYNAGRTSKANDGEAKYKGWKDSNWENDRLWQPSGSAGGWTMEAGTLYQNVAAITQDEIDELYDIFKKTLYRTDDKGNRRNNVPYINNNNAVSFYGNHLVSDGTAPITFIPVQLASTDARRSEIYYYYFNPKDIPSDMTEANYIKSLPKFKAADLGVERNAFNKISHIPVEKNDTTFLKLHEYIMPYYGEPSDFTSTITSIVKGQGYETDKNFYRIRNTEGNYYVTKTSDTKKKLLTQYADESEDIANQLFQVFTNEDGNKVLLYNVGSKQFLKYFTSANTTGVKPQFSAINTELQDYVFNLCGKDNKPLAKGAEKTNVHIFGYDNKFILKADLNNNARDIAVDGKNFADRNTVQWTFEKYTPTQTIDVIDDVTIENWPTTYPTPSTIIPQGYCIGFMLRKGTDTSITDANIATTTNGCVYGYGELNKEINTFGEFKNAIGEGMLSYTSPRIAMFNANLKTYLCFEEGGDVQFSDVIIELGGYSLSAAKVKQEQTPEDPQSGDDPVAPAPSISTLSFDVQPVLDLASADAPKSSGVYLFDEVKESDYDVQAFTMCFEDRPAEADYDLNDVVLRCRRQPNTNNVIILTLEAAGGVDNVYLRGIPGTFRSDYNSSYDLKDKEVHAALNMGDATGNDRMINTRSKTKNVPAISGWYEVSAEMSIPQFLSQIYIENQSQANLKIGVPLTGEPPYALIIPGDFDYPLEFESINKAYDSFGSWARNAGLYDWLNSKNDSKVVDNTQRNP